MIDVSVIIVNYKTEKLLINAIDSVLNKTLEVTFEVIVVDNYSEEDLGRILKERYDERVIYLPLFENVGFGRANNEGIKIASGRYLFFLNPDTLLINNAIGLLSHFLDNHLECGVVGGNLYDCDLKPTHSYSKLFPSIFTEFDQSLFGIISKVIFGKNLQFNYTGIPMEVAYICGADMMVRKSVLDEVGAFDPDFFMYYEETELTFRIRTAGHGVFNIPDVRIIHLEGKSFTFNEMREYRYLCSRKIYYAKTHSKLYGKIADKIYFTTHALAYIMLCLMRNVEYRSKIRQRLKLMHKINKEFCRS